MSLTICCCRGNNSFFELMVAFLTIVGGMVDLSASAIETFETEMECQKNCSRIQNPCMTLELSECARRQ